MLERLTRQMQALDAQIDAERRLLTAERRWLKKSERKRRLHREVVLQLVVRGRSWP
jgi:hypothetical protein